MTETICKIFLENGEELAFLTNDEEKTSETLREAMCDDERIYHFADEERRLTVRGSYIAGFCFCESDEEEDDAAAPMV